MTDGSTHPDTRGRTVLVTGATAGIGYETARVLAERGAQVLDTGRDADRGERAAAAIRGDSGNEHVRCLQADHSTVGGNEELAERVIEAFTGLDVLVNNVGGSYAARWQTADGYEATLAMNLVGPFALTREAPPVLLANAPSRVISVGSAAFQMWKPFPKARWPLLRLLQRLGSPAKAGRLVAYLASSPGAAAYTGQYFAGKPKPARLSARELDPGNQERAWRLAAEFVASAPTSRRRVGDTREPVSV